MLYSSGTTGRPKGVRRLVSGQPYGSENPVGPLLDGVMGFGPGKVYLTPAPLYHSAPLVWSMTVHRSGGTLVLMERFDAQACLDVIDRERVTHAQFVPTMFVRMLKLPDDGAGRVRRVEPRSGRARGGAVPGRGQAAHDRVVGDDRLRVLRGDRGRRAHVDRQHGVARAPGLGRSGRVGRDPHLRRVGGGAPRRRTGNRPFRRWRERVRIPQRPREDAPDVRSSAAGARCGTSGTSMPTATCTSPIASRT